MYIYTHIHNECIVLIALRVLEYGSRAPVFYGSKREKRVFHEYLCRKLVLFLQTSLNISGNLREFTG